MYDRDLQMEWENDYPVADEYRQKPFGYDIEITEFKIYDNMSGQLAAQLTLVDERAWKVDIKSIQDSFSFKELSDAIDKAMNSVVK